MKKQSKEMRSQPANDVSLPEAGGAGGVVAAAPNTKGRRQFVEPELSEAIKVLKATQFFQQFSDNGNTGRPNG